MSCPLTPDKQTYTVRDALLLFSHPCMSPVAVNKSLNGSISSPHMTHIKNMANFQEANPKTSVVCALFRFFGDDIRSFSGWILRKCGSTIYIRKD